MDRLDELQAKIYRLEREKLELAAELVGKTTTIDQQIAERVIQELNQAANNVKVSGFPGVARMLLRRADKLRKQAGL